MALLSASMGFSSGTDFGGSLQQGTDSSADAEAWTSPLASLAESAEFEVTCIHIVSQKVLSFSHPSHP